MIIKSDWHIHSQYSYDSKTPLSVISDGANEQGLLKFGITDHVNYNDTKFLSDLAESVKNVKKLSVSSPRVVLGVELTPIEKPMFDYIKIHGTEEGYIPPVCDTPYDIELAVSKDELVSMGVRYAIGASHWRVDIPNGRSNRGDLYASIKEWHRQQMWLANDERVTVLGHPWYNGRGLWYEDFSIIPRSMNNELAAALLENGKYAECNRGVIIAKLATEKFRHQYAEFLRELFECGIPIVYGSDAHTGYPDNREAVEKYLISAGFKAGDISEISEQKLW